MKKISLAQFSKKSGVSYLTLKSYIAQNFLTAKKIKVGNSYRFLLPEDDISKAKTIRNERVENARKNFVDFKRKQSKNTETLKGKVSNIEVLRWLYGLSPKDFKEFQIKFDKLKTARDEIGI